VALLVTLVMGRGEFGAPGWRAGRGRVVAQVRFDGYGLAMASITRPRIPWLYDCLGG
jgi:hypothetical protein